MNTDDNHPYRQSRQSLNLTAASHHPQVPGTHSFTRNYKAEGVATRSPFAKLTSSSHNAHTPANSINTQSRRHSENTSQSFGRDVPKSFSLSTSAKANPPQGRTPLRSNLSASQNDSLHASTFSYRHHETPQYELNHSNASYLERDRELIDDHDVHDINHSSVTDIPQQSFKMEPLSSPFIPNSSSYHETYQPLTPTIIDNKSALQSAGSYRYNSPPNENIEVSDHKTRPGSRSMTQDIVAKERHSRSASLVPATREETDYSAVMFEVATNLRNKELDLAAQTRAMDQLQAELEASTAERNGLLKRIALVKEKAKESLESHAKKLGDMKNDLQSVKNQFQELVQKTKTSSEDVEEWKNLVKKSTEQLESFRGEDGLYVPTQEWKTVLGEVRMDVANKQQVIDMFRDRLEFVQGELADAKNRIAELESMQEQNNNALQMASTKLANTAERTNELALRLATQQQENTNILTANAELTASLLTRTSEISELKLHISQKDTDLLALVPLQREYDVLCKVLEERDENIKVLSSSKDRLVAVEALLADRESKDEARNDLTETLKKNLLLAEKQTENEVTLRLHIENDLNEIREQIKLEHELREKIIGEKDSLRASEESLHEEVRVVRNDLEEYKIKVRQSDTRYEMLQERFEDQTVMLRMEKKGLSDIQERLFSVEATYSNSIEDTKQKTDAQFTQLKELNESLEGQLRVRQAEIDTKAEEISNLRGEYLKSKQELEGFKENLISRSNEEERLKKELADSQAETQSLHLRVQVLHQASNDLQKKLLGAQLPTQANEEEIHELKRKIEEMQRDASAQGLRAATIVSRYELGNISAEERKLIEIVRRASQTNHEQQLVAKGNEIRQRDNVIKTLEKRKSELESQLARVLNTQAKSTAKATVLEGDRSLIDPKDWASSQNSSSPLDGNPNMKFLDKNRAAKSNLPPSDNATPRPRGVARRNGSPSHASTFSKLSENPTEAVDDIHDLYDNVPLAQATTKRKRAIVSQPIDELDNIRAPRRTRSVARSASKSADDIESEASESSKRTVAAPKVKARKRR